MIPALILARGGSKGIPDKNLRTVGGASLVARCVRQAVDSKFSPVYVWSDSEAIRIEAESAGAKAPERPLELSGDRTTTEDSVAGFLDLVDPGAGFSALAVLQCTTPFLSTHDLDRCFDKYASGLFDSVITACDVSRRFLGYPMHTGESEFVPMRPYRALRQESSPKFWMENGGVYLASRGLWSQGKRLGLRVGVVEMGWWESLEIDEPEDLEVARRICGMYDTRGDRLCPESAMENQEAAVEFVEETP